MQNLKLSQPEMSTGTKFGLGGGLISSLPKSPLTHRLCRHPQIFRFRQKTSDSYQKLALYKSFT